MVESSSHFVTSNDVTVLQETKLPRLSESQLEKVTEFIRIVLNSFFNRLSSSFEKFST